MVDKIGPLILHSVREMSRSGNTVTLQSYFRTENQFRQVEELFRKAENNVSIHNIVGGHQIGFDPTEDSVLTQYCEFDSDKLKKGWFMLLGFTAKAEHKHNYWPFNMKLFFMGTQSVIADRFSVYGLTELTNDWGI